MSEQMTLDLPAAAATSVLAIGLMSGTSQDGVDVALIDTDGEGIAQFGATAAAANLTDRTARPDIVASAEQLVNDAHAEAVETFLAANDLQPANLAAVGFHGQTLLHRPERGLTVQIGDGHALAARLGIPVVYDFRAADVAADFDICIRQTAGNAVRGVGISNVRPVRRPGAPVQGDQA